MEDEKAAIETYDWLVSRACKIAEGAPYWSSVYQPAYARISIEGDAATITWPETDSDHDSCTISGCSLKFPAGLLLITEEELDAWKIEQRAIYDREWAEQKARNAREREANERAVFEALKAKFETPK